jgi:hypothetical protein
MYIWYPDQDQSIEIRDRNSMRDFSHRACGTYHIFLKNFKIKSLATSYRVFSPRAYSSKSTPSESRNGGTVTYHPWQRNATLAT